MYENSGITLFELQNFWINLAMQKTAAGVPSAQAADHADMMVDRFTAKFPDSYPVVDAVETDGV